jgi:predicted glycogen debranching enzyme
MRFGKAEWHSFEQGCRREWLVTNGLGGYGSSTLTCANTRKYHGLLVASLAPPVQRTLLLAKVNERIEALGRVYSLAANRTLTGLEFGHIHLQSVEVDPFPEFTYSFADLTLKKQIFMVYGENTTVLVYTVINGAGPATVRLAPLVNSRDFHWTVTKDQLSFEQEVIPWGVAVQTPQGPPLYLYCREADYTRLDCWYRGMFYDGEQERGESCVEDHFIPGEFTFTLRPGEEKVVTLLASLENYAGRAVPGGPNLLAGAKQRARALVDRAGYKQPLARRLVLAADDFIVQRRSTRARSVIAGYPWFNDWGRDTMIALPGLTLVTGRYDEAREILLTFARSCKDGLLPNMFADHAGDEPLYNTVDASLWFFQAVYKFLEYTGDHDFIREHIYPVLLDIVYHYAKGTRFNIGVDREDGLLQAGTAGVQLTWMDARVDGWVVTPRQGKPVEINALWYNALCILSRLANQYGDVVPDNNAADRVKKSFNKQFWNEEGGCLYDVIGDDGPDDKLRPNQIIALSLPFTMVDEDRGRQVVQRVWQDLYATYGLRSLAPRDRDYRGVYTGDRYRRDGAYHQGTAWSWLMGPFVTAYRKVYRRSPGSRLQAARFLAPFEDHLRDHGLGSISEIFDGNEPVIPRGCYAQAWGVAEILRSYVEDVLEIQPKYADWKLWTKS